MRTLFAKICTKKLQSEQLTLTDFYGAQSLNTSFSNNLTQCLIKRAENIMSNRVLLSTIFLDPCNKITKTQDQ